MNNAKSHKPNRRLPALVAVGGTLAAMPAAAVQLGDLTVQSRLGDPLRASIAIALAPNETISSSCVSIAPVANGWPGVGPASVRVADGVVTINGRRPMREPMVSTRLVVDCPYAARISREYMLFIDPPEFAAPETTSAVAPTQRTTETRNEPVTSSEPVVREPVREPARETTSTPAPTRVAPAPRREQPAPLADIEISSQYRVPVGATASEIVQRIEGRSMALWPAVDQLVAANPDAFVDGDANRLKAGSWLVIPASIGGVVADTQPATESVSDTASFETARTEPGTAVDTSVADTAAVDTAVPDPMLDTSADLLPGDAAETDNPFVEATAGTSTVVIPDTQLEGPETTSESPNVSTAVAVPKADSVDEARTGAPNWLYWLGGSGLLLILALLFFGRRLRGTPEPVAPAMPMRRATDTTSVEQIQVEELTDATDEYDIEDESPTEENLLLDADLVTGSGLSGAAEADVSQDFGFATPASVDVELPFEPEAVASVADTDTQAAIDIETDLFSADDEEDDYDMSVIVDATKMPQPDETTARDLKAIELPDDDDSDLESSGSYTITREVDLAMLEQDYEDELTATQKLNEEIARAAVALAEDIEGEDDSEEASDHSAETSVLPMASVTELDVTTEMTAANSDEVIELDETAEMPSTDDEEDTANMQVESGKLG